MSLDYNEQNKIHKKSIAIKTLYLIDDNFNTFEHVIDCLVAICDHTPIQAEQCALLTHINGKCDILHLFLSRYFKSKMEISGNGAQKIVFKFF